jgi:hypothetical protein
MNKATRARMTITVKRAVPMLQELVINIMRVE